MKVILKSDIKGLGSAGEVKDVSPGYARNFLLPRGLAIAADSGNIETLKKQQQAEQKRRQKEQEEAEKLKEKIEQAPLTIVANAGEGGRLFGSITSKDIGEGLARMGIKIDRRKIMLSEPLRQLGEHQIVIRLQPQVDATLVLEVKAEQ